MAASSPAAFLSSLTTGRHSASYYDRADVDTTNPTQYKQEYTHTAAAAAHHRDLPMGYSGASPLPAAPYHTSSNPSQQPISHDSNNTTNTNYLESCPAGIRCPFRAKHQVEVGRNNSLTASKAVLEESNNYLQRKCDALVVENERLRQELIVSEKSAIEAHKTATAAATNANPRAKSPSPTHQHNAALNHNGMESPTSSSLAMILQQNNHNNMPLATTTAAAPPVAWQQQFQDLKDDIKQATEDKHVLLSQVRVLQEALEQMTGMNEDLLRHIKKVNGGGNSRTASSSAMPTAAAGAGNAADALRAYGNHSANGAQWATANNATTNNAVNSGGAATPFGLNTMNGGGGSAALLVGERMSRASSAGHTAAVGGSGNGDGGRAPSAGGTSGGAWAAAMSNINHRSASSVAANPTPIPTSSTAAAAAAILQQQQQYQYGGGIASTSPIPGRFGSASVANDAPSYFQHQQQQQDDTYLYGGHKGYPAAPSADLALNKNNPLSSSAKVSGEDASLNLPGALSPYRYGPRDASRLLEKEEAERRRKEEEDAKNINKSTNAPRGLTSDMSGMSTAALLEQQRLEKERYDQQQQFQGNNNNNMTTPNPMTQQRIFSPQQQQQQQQQQQNVVGHRVLPIATIIDNLSKNGPLLDEIIPTSRNNNLTPERNAGGPNVQLATPSAPIFGGGGAAVPMSSPAAPLTSLADNRDRAPLPARPRAGSQPASITSYSRSGTPTANHNHNRNPSASSAAVLTADPTTMNTTNSKILDGLLPPQQPQHYKMRDGGSGGDSRSDSVARFRSGSLGGTTTATASSFVGGHNALGCAAHDDYTNVSAVMSGMMAGGVRSATPNGNGRSNSACRPARTPTHATRDHATDVPEEGRDNIYSRLRQQGPAADQGAPPRSGPAGGRSSSVRAGSPSYNSSNNNRPTTPVREGGVNPLLGATPQRLGATQPSRYGNSGASSPVGSGPTEAAAAADVNNNVNGRSQSAAADSSTSLVGASDAAAAAAAERERDAEIAAIENNRKERELRRQQQLKELEALEAQQAELMKKESFRGSRPGTTDTSVAENGGADDDDGGEDGGGLRRPRRTDSALLGSATRLVKRERVVFLRIPGRELYLEMLLKDGAGINRRTHNAGNHPQKALSSIWGCFFKKQ